MSLINSPPFPPLLPPIFKLKKKIMNFAMQRSYNSVIGNNDLPLGKEII